MTITAFVTNSVKFFFLFMLGLILLGPIDAYGLSCDKYKVFYVPFRYVSFYVEASREFMLEHGTRFVTRSCLVETLFHYSTNSTVSFFEEDACHNDFRVMIVDLENDEELFITKSKRLVSLQDKKTYKINDSFMNNVLDDLCNGYKKNTGPDFDGC